MYLIVVGELVEVTQILPPQWKELLCNERKPGRDGDVFLLQAFQETLKLLVLDVSYVLHLVLVRRDGNVLLQKQNVIHLVFTPQAAGGTSVVNPGEVNKLVRCGLFGWNAQFKVESSLCGRSHAPRVVFNGFLGCV